MVNKYTVSQKWCTNGALRCRRNYRKRQKNDKKILLDLFADLAVFESGTKQVNNFEIHSLAQKTTRYDFFNK
jgi:hypothetical protein